MRKTVHKLFSQSPVRALCAAAMLLAGMSAAQAFDPARMLTAEDATAEVMLVHDALQDQHPNFGFYTRARGITQAFEDYAEELRTADADVPVLAHGTRLRSLVAGAGDGHTCIELPPSYLEEAQEKQRFFLPFTLSAIEGRLFIAAVAPGIPAGSELLELGGMPAAMLQDQLAALSCVDGSRPASAIALGARNANYLYHLMAGERQRFEFTIRTPAGDERRLMATPFTLTDMQAEKEPWPAFFVPLERADQKPLSLRFSRSGVPILRVRSFHIPPDEFDAQITDIFARLAEEEARDLIIDVRGNLGGFTSNASSLLAFLLQRPHHMPRFYHVTTRPFRNTDDLQIAGPDTPASAARERANDLKSRMATFRGRRSVFPAGIIVPVTPVNYGRRAAGLRTFVLTDSITASAASIFASQLRRYGDAQFFGEPTGGSEDRGCTQSEIQLELPHSQLLLNLSWLCFQMERGHRNHQAFEPEIEIRQHAEALQRQVDAPLEFVLGYIEGWPADETPLRKPPVIASGLAADLAKAGEEGAPQTVQDEALPDAGDVN